MNNFLNSKKINDREFAVSEKPILIDNADFSESGTPEGFNGPSDIYRVPEENNLGDSVGEINGFRNTETSPRTSRKKPLNKKLASLILALFSSILVVTAVASEIIIDEKSVAVTESSILLELNISKPDNETLTAHIHSDETPYNTQEISSGQTSVEFTGLRSGIYYEITITDETDGEVYFSKRYKTASKAVEPADSDEPDEPVEPEDPDEPDDPVEPDNPDDPVDPDEPITPDDPEDPVDPDEPVTPDDPVDPVDPDEPVTPDDPVDPEDPDEPVEPEPYATFVDTEIGIECILNEELSAQIADITDYEPVNIILRNSSGDEIYFDGLYFKGHIFKDTYTVELRIITDPADENGTVYTFTAEIGSITKPEISVEFLQSADGLGIRCTLLTEYSDEYWFDSELYLMEDASDDSNVDYLDYAGPTFEESSENIQFAYINDMLKEKSYQNLRLRIRCIINGVDCAFTVGVYDFDVSTYTIEDDVPVE